MTFTSLLIAVIGGSGIVWYWICLLSLGFWPSSGNAAEGAFRQFMELSLSTISGTLATYVGLIVGIQSATKVPQPTNTSTFVYSSLTSGSSVNYLQGIAAIVYVISLLVALLAWYRNPERANPTIVALGKSFLGLIGGALIVILNVNVKD